MKTLKSLTYILLAAVMWCMLALFSAPTQAATTSSISTFTATTLIAAAKAEAIASSGTAASAGYVPLTRISTSSAITGTGTLVFNAGANGVFDVTAPGNLTVSTPTGTFANGQVLVLRVYASGTGALVTSTCTLDGTMAQSTTAVIATGTTIATDSGKWSDTEFRWNLTATKWQAVRTATGL